MKVSKQDSMVLPADLMAVTRVEFEAIVARFAADPEIMAAMHEMVDAEIRRRVAELSREPS